MKWMGHDVWITGAANHRAGLRHLKAKAWAAFWKDRGTCGTANFGWQVVCAVLDKAAKPVLEYLAVSLPLSKTTVLEFSKIQRAMVRV